MSGRWRALLIASLALNLLVAGAVLGRLTVAGPPVAVAVPDGAERGPRGGPRGGPVGLGPLVAALAPEDRRAMRRDLARELRGEGLGPRGRQEGRAARAALAAQLRGDAVDGRALATAIAAQNVAAIERQERAIQWLALRLAEMDAAERRAYADRLEALEALAGRGGPRR
ncbi:MAG: hypothetical protein ACU0CO_16685 [Shimia sp.]